MQTIRVTKSGMKCASLAALIVAAAGLSPHDARAQWYSEPEFDARPVHVGIDVGAAVPIGPLASDFNTGWDIGGNVAIPLGYKSPVWFQADFQHSQFGANNSTLAAFNANHGSAQMNVLTGNVVLNLVQSYGQRPAPITPYLIGGGGLYSRYVYLSNYIGNGYCNAFYCGYNGFTRYARTDNEGGWDAGAGVRFLLRPVRFFVEARYNSALTSGGNTNFLPITVGLEW